MPKGKVKKKKDALAVSLVGGDFNLNEKHYDQTESFEVYGSEKKITKIFGVRNKYEANAEPYLKARTRSKTPRGWRFIYGIDLHSVLHVSRFIQGVIRLAKKFGWKIQQTEDLEQMKSQICDNEETILRLEKTNEEWREKHGELMIAFRAKQDQILRSRVVEFETDIVSLEALVINTEGNKILEQDLQEFLYAHPWFFGTEYVNAQPQVLRGAHSKFDFYLERFNKTNDIVEIKLVSDVIVNKDESLNAKVSQSVDQLIEYMESSQAAAYSTVISEEEGIRELRPRGIVIIGNDTSTVARRKLQKWNYQFAHISILTYQDVLDRAKSVLQHLKSQENPTK